MALAATAIADLGGEAGVPWMTAVLKYLAAEKLKALIVREVGKPKGKKSALVAAVARLWAQ